MTGFDFATTTEAQPTNNDAVQTEETPDFVSNEVGDLYLSGVDWEQVLFAIMKGEGFEKLKIQGDDTLEDAPRLLGEHSEAHPTQKLHMIAALFKSTAGKYQTGGFDGIEGNDHSIGLSSSKAPKEHPENYFSYALHSKDLPTIDWDDLDGDEREILEEEYDIDASMMGFDTTYGGPKILEVNGNRLPIAVLEGNEIQEALEILQALPDEPSRFTEDGFVESSDPDVFGESESDTDKGQEDESDTFGLAESPEQVKDRTVNEIKKAVTNISSLRSIKTMLRVEQENENRSSAVERLEQRRSALKGDDEEAEEEAEAEESDDGVEESEWSEADRNLMATLVDSGQAEGLEEAKEMIRSL